MDTENAVNEGIARCSAFIAAHSNAHDNNLFSYSNIPHMLIGSFVSRKSYRRILGDYLQELIPLLSPFPSELPLFCLNSSI